MCDQMNAVRNQLVWTDIPVHDLDRSIQFYNAVLDIAVTKETHGNFSFGLLPHAGESVAGCLTPADADHQPSRHGPLLYLNCAGRLEAAVSAVTAHGGEVLQPIHDIAPHGRRAVILDSEGNRLALHSP